MASNEENRRGSLAISALLNDEPSDKSQSTSPVLSSQPPSKAKRKRISTAQYERLMQVFDQTDTPSSEIRENLAVELDMTKREVQVWFQNRRAKVNRTKNTANKRNSSYSIAPMPPYHPYRKPNAIDLLAKAAEYVRADEHINQTKSPL
ncbi:Homeodomain-like protein [Gilbertella persicaria]|uniref:Homeodomain-like protein n=1 Tax=Gilbertella persicaria TaxID=101096 RepID=UPI002220619C|nr:Homeodomain-like protein [Gilbertella persicaria]KAI8063659.1 Homeodomain-like protein [Gilbertella persicaria]